MIALYRIPYSTNVERVTLALAHKGLEFESVWIEPDDRSEVESVSGQPLVPVLVDEGEVVSDSAAILEYLEERYADPPLYPRDGARRVETTIFVDWFNRVWKRPPNEIDAELAEAQPDEARIEELGTQMREWLHWFDGLLGGRDYLLGDFSAADCAAYPFLKYARSRVPDDDERFHLILEQHQPLERHPHLEAWIERVATRPGAD